VALALLFGELRLVFRFDLGLLAILFGLLGRQLRVAFVLFRLHALRRGVALGFFFPRPREHLLLFLRQRTRWRGGRLHRLRLNGFDRHRRGRNRLRLDRHDRLSGARGGGPRRTARQRTGPPVL